MATLRPVHASTGAISAGVGSAIFEMGNTRVICALYGPHVDARQEFSERGRLACEVKIAAFARAGRSVANAAADESTLAEELQTALAPAIQLESYPKCSWQLCAFVVEDDGSALAALVSCGALALADAGVQMSDLVAACSAVRVPFSGAVPMWLTRQLPRPLPSRRRDRRRARRRARWR
jgi:exosome complex component MTR3